MSFLKTIARARRKLLGQTPPVRARPRYGDTNRYFYLGPERALVRLDCDQMLYVDPLDDVVSASIIAHGCWERRVHRAVLSLVRPGARVIEVGANIGYYTVTMAAAVGEDGFVTAFEANPRLAAMARNSLALNGLSGRTRVIAKAALDQPGTIDFVVSRSNSGGGYVSLWADQPYADGEVLKAEAVRLDDQALGKADLLRIDAEGSEAAILRGAETILRDNADIVICMEWAPVQIASRTSVEDFVAWMRDLGFCFWWIGPASDLIPIQASALVSMGHGDLVVSRNPPRAG